jgi:hypothetical protein
LSILHGWVYAFVPFADKARSASHSVYIWQFAMFILAAHGIDRLLEGGANDADSERWVTRIQRVLLGFGSVLIIALYLPAVEGKMEAALRDRHNCFENDTPTADGARDGLRSDLAHQAL